MPVHTQVMIPGQKKYQRCILASPTHTIHYYCEIDVFSKDAFSLVLQKWGEPQLHPHLRSLEHSTGVECCACLSSTVHLQEADMYDQKNAGLGLEKPWTSILLTNSDATHCKITNVTTSTISLVSRCCFGLLLPAILSHSFSTTGDDR